MAQTPRIYLDTCALNRLTDDQSQMRVRLEAEAIELFFLHLQTGKAAWIGSSVLEMEIRRNPDLQSREDALSMLPFVSEFHRPNAEVADRARLLNLLGYGKIDALHLAIAEYAKVDWLLTTDDRFRRQAGRGLGNPLIRVANPLDSMQEVKP
jgi:predicted nucleic acid-binding protein